MIVEAQGGEKRAKYGNKLIKVYSLKLTKEHGKGYDITNLRHMRAFYLKFRNQYTVCRELTWSHFRTLLPIKTTEEIMYYINICKSQNLSVRELRNKIKLNEYERTQYKEELSKPKVNTLIKNPIVIRIDMIRILMNMLYIK